LIRSEIVLELPDYEITNLQIRGGGFTFRLDTRGGGRVRTAAAIGCAKGRYVRRVRHENRGLEHCVLELEASNFNATVSRDSPASDPAKPSRR
jgi:hypothetical protein